MKAVAAVALALALALALAVGASARVGSTRHDEGLAGHLADRLGLFFRVADKNHDKAISMDDVRASKEQMKVHLPGVSEGEFASFLEEADKDKDGKLTRDELFTGVAAGLKSAGFVELESTARAGAKSLASEKFIGDVFASAKRSVSGFFNKVLGKIDTSQDSCVFCQYIVERCETNVKSSGVIPAMNGAAPGAVAPLVVGAMSDGAPVVAGVPEVASFLEVAEQFSPDAVGASMIGTTRASTRYQRQLERQKYNEIYRVVDVTLDEVCEQAMPNFFYGHCKAVYDRQSDVVDGLRYQYRPADVCFRIGMCGQDSYITRGIHSRYRELKHKDQQEGAAEGDSESK